jgi:hypothetical protein
MSHFYQHIRTLMAQRNINVWQFCKLVKIGPQRVVRWKLANRPEIKANDIRQIASAFKLSPSQVADLYIARMEDECEMPVRELIEVKRTAVQKSPPKKLNK